MNMMIREMDGNLFLCSAYEMKEEVYGKVSPEAIWVKPGNIYGDDYVLLQWKCLDCGAICNSQEHSSWAGCTAGYENYYLIKCPTCGTFH